MTNENLQYEDPFYRKRLDEDKAKDKGTIMTVRLNAEELAMLKEVKEVLQQPKDSTAIKTMFYLAYFNVIQDKKTTYLISTLFKNKRNNERSGAYVD